MRASFNHPLRVRWATPCLDSLGAAAITTDADAWSLDGHARKVRGVLSHMAQIPQSPQTTNATRPGWAGWAYFAGIMMLMLGCFVAIQGLAALFRSAYYLVPERQLLIEVSYTAWGWPLLILGAILVVAGLGVMVDQTWARVAGIVVALLSALVNLAFAPAYPIWSALVIALCVVVIYALTVHGREAGLEP
jgi:hypothetical protein